MLCLSIPSLIGLPGTWIVILSSEHGKRQSENERKGALVLAAAAACVQEHFQQLVLVLSYTHNRLLEMEMPIDASQGDAEGRNAQEDRSGTFSSQALPPELRLYMYKPLTNPTKFHEAKE